MEDTTLAPPTELDPRGLEALDIYFRTYRFSDVATRFDITVDSARGLVNRAKELRIRELLGDVDALILAQMLAIIGDIRRLSEAQETRDTAGLAPDLDVMDQKLKEWERLSKLLGLDKPLKILQFTANLTEGQLTELRDRRWAALSGTRELDLLAAAIEEAPSDRESEVSQLALLPEPAVPSGLVAAARRVVEPVPAGYPRPGWGDGHDQKEDEPITQVRFKDAPTDGGVQ